MKQIDARLLLAAGFGEVQAWNWNSAKAKQSHLSVKWPQSWALHLLTVTVMLWWFIMRGNWGQLHAAPLWPQLPQSRIRHSNGEFMGKCRLVIFVRCSELLFFSLKTNVLPLEYDRCPKKRATSTLCIQMWSVSWYVTQIRKMHGNVASSSSSLSWWSDFESGFATFCKWIPLPGT